MEYMLFTQGQFTGYTIEDSDPALKEKCERLRLRQIPFFRYDSAVFDRALGVVEGGKTKPE